MEICLVMGLTVLFAVAATADFSAYAVSGYRPYLLAGTGLSFVCVSTITAAVLILLGMLTATLGRVASWSVLRNPLYLTLQLIGQTVVWLSTCSAIGWREKLTVVPFVVCSVAIVIDFVATLGNRTFGLLVCLCEGLLYLCLCAMVVLRHSTGKFEFHTLFSSKLNLAMFASSAAFACLGMLMCVAIVGSDSFPPASVESMAFWLCVPVPICCDACIALRESAVGLRLRREEPPQVDNEMKTYSMDRVVSLFAARHGLTQRETEVLRLLVMGETNASIANQLVITTSTAKVHVHNIMKKVGVAGRKNLAKEFWSTS